MDNTVICLENIVKTYGQVRAVDGVSLQIRDGEFLALLGPSGCGKTTLLRMLGGFDHPTSGRILMQGKDITALPPNKRPINMLFQSYAIFPHMSVSDNVGYGLRMERLAADEISRRVDEALRLVQMQEYAARMPHKLSGGQRQRVALARALIKKPKVLLLDEPLSALDAKLREAMQNELVNLQKTVGITFVVVTHDQDEALSMAERIAVMNEGKFSQIAPPRILYESPDNRFVADFIGRMNIAPCAVESGSDEDGYQIDSPHFGRLAGVSSHQPMRVGASAYIGIRPEKLMWRADAPAAGEHSCRGVLESYSYHGDETVLTCKTESGLPLICATTNDRRLALPPTLDGRQGWIVWRVSDMILLAD